MSEKLSVKFIHEELCEIVNNLQAGNCGDEFCGAAYVCADTLRGIVAGSGMSWDDTAIDRLTAERDALKEQLDSINDKGIEYHVKCLTDCKTVEQLQSQLDRLVDAAELLAKDFEGACSYGAPCDSNASMGLNRLRTVLAEIRGE